MEIFFRNVAEKIAELKRAGVKKIVFMDTVPGNPLGNIYPEGMREDFLDKLQRAGVIVIIDGVYSTYSAPDSQNFPYNVFRGVEDMKGRIMISGATKDGPCPMPGLRIGWAAGDPDLIRGMHNIHAMTTGGVSSLVQEFTEKEIRRILENYGNHRFKTRFRTMHQQFADALAMTNRMVREALAEMGFTVLKSEANDLGINRAGMYLLTKGPDGSPDFVSGYSRWCKQGIPPGLPLETFSAKADGMKLLRALRTGNTDGRPYPFAPYARICIGANIDTVEAAIEAIRERISQV